AKQASRLPSPRRAALACLAVGALALSACATTGAETPQPDRPASSASSRTLAVGLDVTTNPDPFPSTYQPLPRRNAAIVGGTVFTATGLRIESGVVLMADGKVEAVGGPDTPVPAGYE